MAFRSSVRRNSAPYFQVIAVFICLAFAAVMIVNTQFAGDAVWFWYAEAFHRGVKLYSGLHIPLQPLFIILTDFWIRLMGVRVIPVQTSSFVYALLMCCCIGLVLRSSPRPDWQKAIALIGAFILTVGGGSYRFDDYHVVSESLIYLSIGLSLLATTARTARAALVWSALLGLVSGLLITARVTDGVGVFLVVLLTLPALLPQKRLAGWALCAAVGVVTVLLVILLTGDSVTTWASSTIFKAAANKGGTGSIFSAPFKVIPNDLKMFLVMGKRVSVILLTLPIVAWLLHRYLRLRAGTMVFALLACAMVGRLILHAGNFVDGTVLLMIPFMYLPAIFSLIRGAVAWQRHETGWDRRWLAFCIPAIVWAAYAASAAADPLMNYYSPMAMVLLLWFVMLRPDGGSDWLAATLVAVWVLISVNDGRIKWAQPYHWQDYIYSPMFTNRQWYHHPVLGTMYIDKDLLQFSEAACADIGAQPGRNQPELLSLPYPYPNYFCYTPPWHNEVQTFFDTATRQMIQELENRLDTAPPKYIIYQRQLKGLKGHEELYHHGAPIAQQDLDTLIMNKLASGQWHLIERRHYLRSDGWYIIQTHP